MDSNYELIDCGNGRRLERFGTVICDRPAPMAEFPARAGAGVWAEAALRFDAVTRRWTGTPPADWAYSGAAGDAAVRLGLTPGANGQLGIFPEQQENWEWLARIVGSARGRRVRVLNGFAYTGGSTLFCAAAGAEVCHLDASGAAVAQARKNAELSGLSACPVRWIVDDVKKFLAREIRRKSFYDGIILDPPAFGRSGKNIWKLEDNLPELLEMAAAVLTPEPLFVLLTCHPAGWTPEDLRKIAVRYFPRWAGARAEAQSVPGRCNRLPLGLRWRGE